MWERAPLRLRAMYERFGYAKYRMSRFEAYDIYRENKEFLRGEGIVTFTDASGRLMALKPDVTMSIVKNIAKDTPPQKLYYNESVFRTEQGELREINQMGLEYIGGGEGYADAEVIALAVDTLAVIADEYTLDISHMGYISAMLMNLGLNGDSGEAVLSALRQKNPGELRALAKEFELSEQGTAALLTVEHLRGELGALLESGQLPVLNEGMNDALTELQGLYRTLSAVGKRVSLDFSVINDLDYYNGLVFRGYIRSAPRSVLAGGRYDKLMLRFGKPMTAIGFALYLTSLDRVFRAPKDYDVDTILIYGDAPPERVAVVVREIIAEGCTVRADRTMPAEIRARRVLELDGDSIREVRDA